MYVPNRAKKGKTGDRTIPLHPDLQAALVTLQTSARGHGHPRAARSWGFLHEPSNRCMKQSRGCLVSTPK